MVREFVLKRRRDPNWIICRVQSSADFRDLNSSNLQTSPFFRQQEEAIASRLDAIALRLEAITSMEEAIAFSKRLEAFLGRQMDVVFGVLKSLEVRTGRGWSTG